MTTTRPTCGTCGSHDPKVRNRTVQDDDMYPCDDAKFHDAPKPGAESEEFEDDPTAGETEG